MPNFVHGFVVRSDVGTGLRLLILPPFAPLRACSSLNERL